MTIKTVPEPQIGDVVLYRGLDGKDYPLVVTTVLSKSRICGDVLGIKLNGPDSTPVHQTEVPYAPKPEGFSWRRRGT
jgi:hypothetical protein